MRSEDALSDADARSRFAGELNTNFSVLAPAGVGKTRSIVDRIVNCALSDPSGDRLAHLAVVTYTNKAADEMQQRARNSLLAHDIGPSLMGSFNRAFFGTIHGFCLALLRAHGHFLGLPGSVELLDGDDEAAAWTEFYRSLPLPFPAMSISEAQLRACLRHLPVQHVMSIARSMDPDIGRRRLKGDSPPVDFSSVEEFESKRAGKYVQRGKELARRWMEAYTGGAAFLPIPEYDKGGRGFQSAWRTALTPIRDWLGTCSLVLARDVARMYREYRVRLGALTYSDQVSLVLDLLPHSEAGNLLRKQGYVIILDEAQDTDPTQFQVLLELARPPAVEGLWMKGAQTPPGPGRFSMVGDPQQSIYAGRANLSFYRDVREKLCSEAGAHHLEFHVTFRCAERISATVNGLCQGMLSGKQGQVAYVPLTPRPDAPGGEVVRLPVEAPALGPEEGKRIPVNEAAAAEADTLARWIKDRGEAGLGLRSWSDLAILCARKRWIDPIEQALLGCKLPVQNHSQRSVRGDDPAYAWFTALIVCCAEPRNSFEIVGVLREVFGIPDSELWKFARGDGKRFQIRDPVDGRGPVSAALNLLHGTRTVSQGLPLLQAVAMLVAETGLRDRLAAILPMELSHIDRQLDSLLSLASTAESAGCSMAELAADLTSGYSGQADGSHLISDAIQIITCHAAKGLEWSTVIVPFLFRDIASRGSDYPYVHSHYGGKKANVVFARSWMDEETRDHIRRAAIQENQRLLYVAMTRAKNMLVLPDDSALFGQAKGSFAACLGSSEGTLPVSWEELPQLVDQPCAAAVMEPPAELPSERALSRKDLADAVRAASRFPKRILPHALAEHDFDGEPELRLEHDPEEPASRELAIDYGNWWHALMESLDWRESRGWGNVFSERLPEAPMPERAQREWDLFLRSDIAKRLQDQDLSVHTEVPFIRLRDDGTCVEGFIDLAAFAKSGEDCVVLDWKTNDVTPSELADLASIYAPQIAEYAQAVRELCRVGHVESLIYSTACGRAVELNTQLGVGD